MIVFADCRSGTSRTTIWPSRVEPSSVSVGPANFRQSSRGSQYLSCAGFVAALSSVVPGFVSKIATNNTLLAHLNFEPNADERRGKMDAVTRDGVHPPKSYFFVV